MDKDRVEQRSRLSDIRLQELPLEFDGRVYKLRCNMNVLADVQEDFGGILSLAVDGRAGLKSNLSFLAAMLNDYAEDMGWPERYTRRELGKKLGWSGYMQLPIADIHRLIASAILPPAAANDDAPADEPDGSKN